MVLLSGSVKEMVRGNPPAGAGPERVTARLVVALTPSVAALEAEANWAVLSLVEMSRRGVPVMSAASVVVVAVN